VFAVCPVLTLDKVDLIADASATAIRHVEVMHDEQRYSYNWITLFNVFTLSLTLIYSIIAQPDPLPIYLRRSDALDSLGRASKVLGNFAQKFPKVARCRTIVQDVYNRLTAILEAGGPSNFGGEVSGVAHMTSDSRASHNTSFPVRETAESAEPTSFPTRLTGNALFDQLQTSVSAPDYSNTQASINSDDNSMRTALQASLPQTFQLGATMAPYGDATAQFMAAGLGSSGSTEMDLDPAFMDFLDGNLYT
jgi:hypothetical protein